MQGEIAVTPKLSMVMIDQYLLHRFFFKLMSSLLDRFAHSEALEPFKKQLNPLWCEVEY